MKVSKYELIFLMSAKNYKVFDKRVDFKASDSRLYQLGPSDVTLVEIPSTGNNALNPQFVVNSPALNNGVSRYARVRLVGKFTVLLAANAATTFKFALRALPITAMTQTITVKVNNTSITTSDASRQRAAILSTNCPTEISNSYMSTTATMRDIVTRYSDDKANAQGTFSLFMDGAQGDGVDAPRTLFTISAAADNPKRKFIVEVDITEPIMCPPFNGDDSYIEALGGINQIQVNYFTYAFERMFCSTQVVTSVTEVPNSVKWSLLTSFLTADSKLAVERPLRYRYNCPRIDYSYVAGSSFAATPAGKMSTVSLPDMQLSSIPRFIIFWATPNDANASTLPNLADVILPIRSVNIKFCNRSGLLSGLTEAQLYEISKQSGLNAHYAQFIGQLQSTFNVAAADADIAFKNTGVLNACPLVIDVAQFLSIPEGAAVGCRYPTAFNAKLECFNSLSYTTEGGAAVEDYAPLFHRMIIYDQELITEGGNAALIDGFATVQEVQAAQVAPAAAVQSMAQVVSRAGIYGGSFFDSLLNIGKQILPAVGNIAGEAVGVPGLGSIASGLLGAGAGSNTGGARMSKNAMLKMQSS